MSRYNNMMAEIHNDRMKRKKRILNRIIEGIKKMITQKGEETDYVDCSLEPIFVGDKFMIPQHNGKCCNHLVECTVERRDVGTNPCKFFLIHKNEIVAPIGIAAAYRKIK